MEYSFYSRFYGIKLFRCFKAFVIKILSRRTQYPIQFISDIFVPNPGDLNLAHCVSSKSEYSKVKWIHSIKYFSELVIP